ncbi:conserved Plasmodium protein, unknown function [Plasmodium yoelii]|uniref:Uncharacterized protein n=1 Tax=Plasmodium yoelii TaxID=5861 RepID=A0A078K2Q5_PLAYE|nr:conserved Plasmodium protein, unknown function [Plasmodium yoelii]CDU17275.1 conserved Plasmodium protein, unknown function [Plasmodium yoelii]VTZ76488.1 conserved Plasmodium protein, unknown function [Plasmodium yoelii]|eukprot:XP_022811815.1 conserved Plasmodium protein, unknown function [Plasmodium yoelii]
MDEKKVDNSPLISKMETFEISDKIKKSSSKKEIKNVYRSLDNEFNFDDEQDETNQPREENNNKQVNEDNNNENKMNARTIKIDRKNLKKMFSSQFFTQTLTDTTSSNTISEIKIGKKYAIFEFFKTLIFLTLFITTSYFTYYYVFNYYFGQTHICSHLDLYNYKYENEVKFIPTISNKKYYVFTGKFPFDVITYKLRKEDLKNSMNKQIDKYKQENPGEIIDPIGDLDNYDMQIISFMKYNNKMKCEKKIFDLYKPFSLKTTDANITNSNFILNEISYNFITNPYSINEKKLYEEVSNFMQKSENKNKICYITSYLKSLKDDNIIENIRSLNENTTPNVMPIPDPKNEIINTESTISDIAEKVKNYFMRGSSTDQNNNINTNNTNTNNDINLYRNNTEIYPKKKIVFLYDYYENNFVDLVIAIYNMQYGNTYSDLKEYWDDIRKGFKVMHPEEIYLFEWYCLGINYNIIKNNNQYKLKCVDLLK